MGFESFWLQFNNGKKEQLGDAKSGIRKEQVDKKFHNLFDAYDTNQSEVLESGELEGIFRTLSVYAGNDKILDNTENQLITSIFGANTNIKDIDFQGFVKSVSVASADILSSTETQMEDGGKEISTIYKDGTKETVGYYPNGEFKYKKTEKMLAETHYYVEINGQKSEVDKQEYELELKRMKKMQAQQNKPKIIDDYQFNLPSLMSDVKISSQTEERPDVKYDFSGRAYLDIQARDFLLTHFIETHYGTQDALDTMGTLDDIGAAINAGVGDLWNACVNVYNKHFGNGTEKDYKDFDELVKKFEPQYDQAVLMKPQAEAMQRSPELYFKNFETNYENRTGNKYNLQEVMQFQQLTEQFQVASVLSMRMDCLKKALNEVRMYQSTQDALTYNPVQSEGMNPAQHLSNAQEYLLQYFDNDKEAADLVLNGTIGNADKTLEAINSLISDTELQLKDVLNKKEITLTEENGELKINADSIGSYANFEELKAKYQNSYKAMYGTDFVPDELTDKVMSAKATGGFVKIAAITIVSILITKSPVMANIMKASAGAVVDGASANFIRGLVSKYGQTVVQQGIKFALSTGTLATDVGLTLLNQITDNREGINGEEVWETTKGAAKYIYFGAFVGSPIAQAVTQKVGKLGIAGKLFANGTKTTQGAITTTSITGEQLVQNFMKASQSMVAKGAGFATDIAAFTLLDITTEDIAPGEALTSQAEMLTGLRVMHKAFEYMLGARTHTEIQKANWEAAIEKSGVKNWNIKEIKTPTADGKGFKVVYDVDFNGIPLGKMHDANALITAMMGKVSETYHAMETEANSNLKTETAKFEKTRPKQKDLLEGGIKAEDLTEVAPFARHLTLHEVIDPMKAIGENLDIRANKTSFDLTNFESTGLPLKYSTKEFAETLKSLVNDMKIEEQQAILEKFNIILVFTEKGFELVYTPKLPRTSELKTSLDRQIASEIERFTKNNEFMIENPEMKVFLDDFVKIVPEFLFMVGKQQHDTHAFTLDVHTFKVLQNAIEHPEYARLSAENKLVLNTTILLHGIGKRFIDATTSNNFHAEHSQELVIKLLDRFNLPSDVKQRITKLINNYEFFKSYNEAYISYQYEEGWNVKQKNHYEAYGWGEFTPKTDAKNYFNSMVKNVAGQMISTQDLQLAKILTFADLKSVNPEKVFVEESWTQGENKTIEYTGFEKFVTKTKTEEDFLDYIDKSLSFIEKELSQYPDGKIDNELVYKTELQETSQKLFGYLGFFDGINRNQNQTYGVHRSDYDFCIRMRQQLIDMGYKPKNAVKLLARLLKYDSNRNFDAKRTEEFINFYLKEKAFLEKHNIDLSEFRSLEKVNESINLIKQKENIANVFSKYNINDESLQKRLSNVLFIKEYQQGTTFSKEAFDKMVELLETKKYTPEQVIQIIRNSFSIKNHRGCLRDDYNSNSYFNEQIYNTILDLAKLEPLERAIKDAHLCFISATPESGWVVMPEFVEAIKIFNKLGIEEKGFIPMLFDIKYKEGKSKYDATRVLESVTPNESFDIALKYAKQGFMGYDLQQIVKYTEIVNGDTSIQEKIATLCKRGVMLDDFHNEDIRINIIKCFDIDKYRFNEENYNFVLEMLDLGITPEQLNTFIYQSLSFNTDVARKVAPTKIVETSRFNKAQVEALTKFYKEIGFDKIPRGVTNLVHKDLAASFMDTNLLPEEQAQMIINGDLVGKYKMNSYMAPFRVVNTDKYNQALEYCRKGVDISNIKELTQVPELWEFLKTETDLSFVKTRKDAILIANFWHLKDVTSIDELSKSEKMQLMTSMMINKSAFENNNVSTKIKLLPTTSEGYAQLMKTLAHSFGFDKPQYTEAQVQQVNMAFESMITSIQKANPSSLAKDANINKIVTEIKTLIPELANIDLSYLQRVFNNPSFETLSSKEKTMITLASLFSSSELPLADVAIDASVCAMRLGLSETDAMNIHAIVKNSNLVNDFMSINKSTKINNSRSYVTIKSSTLDDAFTTAALELKDYNNYQMARMLYTAKENYLSSEMLKEFAPELYNEFNTLIQNGKSSIEAMNIISNNPSNFDKIESIKLKAAEKYAPSRHFNKMLESEIKHIKASDVLLPQTDLQGFIAKQTPEWIEAHTRLINGRKVLVISSDEIPDFYHLSHTTQAFAITGKADATTNISNFEAFAMLFDNKTVCLSYSGNGKTAVVGTTGLLIRTENTSQYIARGTDISSVAKDIPAMVSEYISRRSSIEQIDFQSKRTKDFDRQYFASMIKEELRAGYRELLNKKLTLEEQIRNGYADENITPELQIIEAQMLATDEIYIQKLDALIKKADGKPIDIEFIRQNDPELGRAYDNVLSYINVEHRGDDGLMRTEYHNEVLGSKTTPVGIFVINEKALFELTDDYLKKAEEDNMPIVILK